MCRNFTLIGILIALTSCDQSGDTKSNAPPPLDQTATTLPAGVRDKWIETLDRALNQRFSVSGRWVIHRDNLGRISFWPVATVGIRCGGVLSNIELVSPWSEDGSTETIPLVYSLNVGDDTTDIGQSLFGLRAPGLGVGEDSPAAIALMSELCQRVAAHLQK
jgi:hypothetical protein